MHSQNGSFFVFLSPRSRPPQSRSKAGQDLVCKQDEEQGEGAETDLTSYCTSDPLGIFVYYFVQNIHSGENLVPVL